jgi:hypothetical protein
MFTVDDYEKNEDDEIFKYFQTKELDLDDQGEGKLV